MNYNYVLNLPLSKSIMKTTTATATTASTAAKKTMEKETIGVRNWLVC